MSSSTAADAAKAMPGRVPQIRKGANGKVTMADAANKLHAVHAFEMLHGRFTVDELDRQHPRLEVPDEVLLDSSCEQVADK